MKLLLSFLAAMLLCGCASMKFETEKIALLTSGNTGTAIYSLCDTPMTMSANLLVQSDGIDSENIDYPASLNVFLVQKDDQKILIDSGWGGQKGALLTRLSELQIAPEQITAVLLTHFHPDHIGGLLDEQGRKVFANAQIYMSLPEFEFVTGQAKNYLGKRAAQIIFAYKQQLQIFEPGAEVLPGITALPLAGHTPGHTAFKLGEVFFAGDVLHIADFQLANPEVSTIYDADGVAAAKSRSNLLNLAAQNHWIIAAAHWPRPGFWLLQPGAQPHSWQKVDCPAVLCEKKSN